MIRDRATSYISKRRLRARSLMLISAAAAVLGLAACGSSSSNSSSSSSTPTQASTTSPSAVAGQSSASSPTGAPIVLANIGDYESAAGSWPEQLAGAQAAADAINAAGGINGRPVKVTGCNTAYNVNTGSACARQAVSAGAIAEVGEQEVLGSGSTDVFTQAKMAMVGVNPLAPNELTSDVSFPLNGGALSEITGACAAATDVMHATAVTVVATDLPQTVPDIQACEQILKAQNIVPTVVKVPPNAADETPYALSVMASKPQAIVVFSLPSDFVQILTAIKQAGYTGDFITIGGLIGSYTGSALNTVEQLLNGGTISWIAIPTEETSNPDLSAFFANMKEYAPTALLSGYALDAWQSVMAFKAIAEKLSTINRASFLNAISSATSVQVPGLPTLNFTKTGVIPVPGTTRITNPEALFTSLKNGQLTTIKGFFDPWT
jgi:ABC-type branched-subunit amino acid transport system substrate-binding protein